MRIQPPVVNRAGNMMSDYQAVVMETVLAGVHRRLELFAIRRLLTVAIHAVNSTMPAQLAASMATKRTGVPAVRVTSAILMPPPAVKHAKTSELAFLAVSMEINIQCARAPFILLTATPGHPIVVLLVTVTS